MAMITNEMILRAEHDLFLEMNPWEYDTDAEKAQIAMWQCGVHDMAVEMLKMIMKKAGKDEGDK